MNDPQKNGLDQFSTFMSPGLAESVPLTVVLNGDKTSVYPAAGAGN